MEMKTSVVANEGASDIFITREFQLPVELLFTAFQEPELIAQWMGTTVLKFEGKQHGSYHFETTDPSGKKHHFSGVIHTFIPHQKIIRTFEMDNMGFGVQLEIYEFEALTDNTSKLKQQVIYQSVHHRNEHMKLPFKQGINWAHNRLESLLIP